MLEALVRKVVRERRRVRSEGKGRRNEEIDRLRKVIEGVSVPCFHVILIEINLV